LSFRDITVLALLLLPTILLVSVAGAWFWNHDISLLDLLYPTPYQSRGN